MSKKITSLCSLFMLLFVLGCKKENNAPSILDYLTSGTWKFSKATASGINVTSLIDACIRDNTITFNKASSGNTGVVDEGPTKCNATDPQTINFTWTFDANFNRIILTGSVMLLPGGSNEFTVVRASNTELVLSQNISIAGAPQLVEATFVK